VVLKEDATFISYAVTNSDGTVVCATPYAVNSRIAPGGAVLDTIQATAEYVASWAPTGPGQRAHVWLGGGVEAPVGGTLDGLPKPDASAAGAR
jgi:hypothetical protein